MKISLIEELIASADKICGFNQVVKGIEHETIRLVVLAQDAKGITIKKSKGLNAISTKIIEIAKNHGIKVVFVPSKEWLGKIAGLNVGCSVMGITDDNLARQILSHSRY